MHAIYHKNLKSSIWFCKRPLDCEWIICDHMRYLLFLFLSYFLPLAACSDSGSADTPPIRAARLPWPLPAVQVELGQWVLAPPAYLLRELVEDPDIGVSFYAVQVHKKLNDSIVVVRHAEGTLNDTLHTQALIPLGMAETDTTSLVLTCSANGAKITAWRIVSTDTLRYHMHRGKLQPQQAVRIPAEKRLPIHAGQLRGAYLRYETPDGWVPGWLIATLGDTYIIGTDNFKLRQVPRAQCVLMLEQPKLQEAQQVWIPTSGKFMQGKVIGVDAQRGGAFVEYRFAGQNHAAWFAFGRIATDIRQPIP